MKCKCGCEMIVKRGEPIKEDDKAYWQHIFTCSNEKCAYYGKELIRKTNIFDETDIKEVSPI